MLTRRTFNFGFACCVRPSPGSAQTPHARRTCFFDATDIPGGKIEGFKTLDFKEPLVGGFQNGLPPLLSELADLFEVKVAFGFYDDPSDFPNAGADPSLKTPLMDGSIAADGTIAIGRHLISEIQTLKVNFSTAVTAICAHEHGHIMQGRYIFPYNPRMRVFNDLNERSDRGIELHADFVCGYFAFFRRQEDHSYPAVLQACTQSMKGDTGAIQSHGTPEQRGNAVNAGYLLAKAKGKVTPEEVALSGLRYVSSDAAWTIAHPFKGNCWD